MRNCATVQTLHFLCNAEGAEDETNYAMHCTPNGVTVLLHRYVSSVLCPGVDGSDR